MEDNTNWKRAKGIAMAELFVFELDKKIEFNMLITLFGSYDIYTYLCRIIK